MPVKRTLAKASRRLDDHKIEQLLEGPERCLLAGVGYIGRMFFWDMDHNQKAELLADIEVDWRENGERMVAWWIDLDAEPICSVPWIFPLPGGPGTRPWAWWEFDAPEDARDGETERDYLLRLGLMLPGEAELPTRDQRDAASFAAIEAEIDTNLRGAGSG